MDLSSLEVFRAVAREQGVSRAAELLDRVPSNVTTRIQQLETEVGVQLFIRDRKRMMLTAEGETYLDYADRILNLADEARQVVNPTSPSGTLRVGSMECTVASRLPVPLASFNARWPQVGIELSTAPTRQLVERLLAHRIDCAFIAVPSGESWLAETKLDRVAAFREELVLLLPAGHPEVRAPSDIRPNALAAFAPGCTYRMLAEEWLTGLAPGRGRFGVQEVGSYHAMLACTAAGACVSVMPRSVFRLLQPSASIELKPLMTVDTYLACRPGFATPAFREFRDAVLEHSDVGGGNGKV